jgi:hypothetical protein
VDVAVGVGVGVVFGGRVGVGVGVGGMKGVMQGDGCPPDVWRGCRARFGSELPVGGAGWLATLFATETAAVAGR